jgi:hypothetical protein
MLATECRMSEAPAELIDLSSRVIVFESLMKRNRSVFRAVPLELLDMLDLVHCIRGNKQRRPYCGHEAA